MSTKINNSRQKGFTLVEALVYAAGTVLLLGVIVGALYYAYSWYGYATISPRVDQVGVSLADKIMSDIRTGTSIDVAHSTFNSSAGKLTLNELVSTTTSVTRVYAATSGRVTFQENSGAIQYLTPANIYVSSLIFNQITTPISSAVHFSISIDYTTRNGTSSNSYSGVGILRNSY